MRIFNGQQWRTAALGVAAAVGFSGCFLADPRPSPGTDAEVQSATDAGIKNLSDSATLGSDAGAGPSHFDQDLIEVSASTDTPSDVAVVGLDGATLPDIGVRMVNVTAMGTPVDVPTTALGQFVGRVPAQIGDVIELTALLDGVGGSIVGEMRGLDVGDYSTFTAPLAVGDPDDADGLLEFSAALVAIVDNGDGTVTLTGGAAAASASVLVVAGNETNGASASTLSLADGSFVLTVDGASGDSLVLFAVDPATGDSSQTQLVVVP